MNEEIEISIDDLIEYINFEKIRGTKTLTRDDAIMLVRDAFDEAEHEADENIFNLFSKKY